MVSNCVYKGVNMNTYVISDTHFNHSNIIKYCDRPFKNVTEMNNELIKRWNNKVSKEDIVYHLGDFAFGNLDYISSIVLKLNGRIRLILGNHDSYNPNKYIDCGFDRVYDKPIIYSDYFILSHKPMEWIDETGVFANIYGHIHNDKRYNWVTRRSFNVSADVVNFTPVNIDKIIESMLKQEMC